MFIKDSKKLKEDFYKNVKKEIYSLRNCYNVKEVQNWSDKDLARRFLVDGCALLQFIVLDVNDEWEKFSDDNDLVSIEKVDFFLLENQLPCQLLEILIDSFAEALSAEITGINPKELIKKSITEFINRSLLSLSAQQQHQIQIDYSQPHPPHEQ
ncbi:hypothetical protein SLA2020_378850 [Shorea laevis]